MHSHQNTGPWAILVIALCAFATGERANADVATFVYEATVTSVDIPSGHTLEGMLDVGQTISGSFQYDVSLQDEASGVDWLGRYQALPAGGNRFRASGGSGFQFDSASIARPYFVATVEDTAQVDNLLLNLSGDTFPSTLAQPDTNFVEVGLLLETTNTNIFSSDVLPSELNASQFELAGIDFFGSGTSFPNFLIHTQITSLQTLPEGNFGDFNGNGFADANDFQTWQSNFGQQANAFPNEGDANSDGDIDGNDFLIWQQAFSSSQAASLSGNAQSVPEPTAVMLFCLLFIGTFLLRK